VCGENRGLEGTRDGGEEEEIGEKTSLGFLSGSVFGEVKDGEEGDELSEPSDDKLSKDEMGENADFSLCCKS
jgi:hypothetical protein